MFLIFKISFFIAILMLQKLKIEQIRRIIVERRNLSYQNSKQKVRLTKYKYTEIYVQNKLTSYCHNYIKNTQYERHIYRKYVSQMPRSEKILFIHGSIIMATFFT